MIRTRTLVLPATTAIVAALAPIALGASRPQAHSAKTTVSVAATEFKFALKPPTGKAGAETFRVRNAGRTDHDFKIAGKKTPLIKPGKTATLTVTLKKGTYPYLCTVPGHAQAGMKGTFRVQ